MKLSKQIIRRLIQEEISNIVTEETATQQRDTAITQISNILVRLEQTNINAQDVLNAAKEAYEANKPGEAQMERKLTAPEKEKREEVAQAMEEEDPNIDMSKKMAIATAQAKKNA